MIDFADQVTESSAEFIGRYDTAPDLVGDKDYGTSWRGECEAKLIDLGLDSYGVFAAGFKKIRCKECQTVDEKKVAVFACGANCPRQMKWLLNGCPCLGTIGAVPLDLRVHLGIIPAFRGRHEGDARSTLGNLLCESALATADTAEHQNDGSGLRLLQNIAPCVRC